MAQSAVSMTFRLKRLAPRWFRVCGPDRALPPCGFSRNTLNCRTLGQERPRTVSNATPARPALSSVRPPPLWLPWPLVPLVGSVGSKLIPEGHLGSLCGKATEVAVWGEFTGFRVGGTTRRAGVSGREVAGSSGLVELGWPVRPAGAYVNGLGRAASVPASSGSFTLHHGRPSIEPPGVGSPAARGLSTGGTNGFAHAGS